MARCQKQKDARRPEEKRGADADGMGMGEGLVVSVTTWTTFWRALAPPLLHSCSSRLLRPHSRVSRRRLQCAPSAKDDATLASLFLIGPDKTFSSNKLETRAADPSVATSPVKHKAARQPSPLHKTVMENVSACAWSFSPQPHPSDAADRLTLVASHAARRRLGPRYWLVTRKSVCQVM